MKMLSDDEMEDFLCRVVGFIRVWEFAFGYGLVLQIAERSTTFNRDLEIEEEPPEPNMPASPSTPTYQTQKNML